MQIAARDSHTRTDAHIRKDLLPRIGVELSRSHVTWKNYVTECQLQQMRSRAKNGKCEVRTGWQK